MSSSMNFSGARTAPLPSRDKYGGKVFVEKPEILEDVILASIDKSHQKRYRTEVINRQETMGTIKPLPDPIIRQKASLDQLGVPKHNFTSSAQLSRDNKDKQFPVVMDKVDKASKFLEGIERDMKLFEEAKNNKTRRQYEDWNINVHGEIQRRITNTLNSMDSKELNRQKNEDYDHFLSITNKKAAIFRDIIIESEYDPLEPNRRCVQAKTRKLKDPVDISNQKAEEEASMLQGGVASKSRKPRCKDTLNVELWASGKIEATPYGTFAKMMDKPATSKNGDDAGQSATLRSHIAFDHFNFPKGKAAIDVEMPRGKRIYPTVTYSNPGKIFGHLSPQAEKELAQIHLPETRNPTY